MDVLMNNLFDSTIYLIAVYDDSYNIIYSNAAFKNFFGDAKAYPDITDKASVRKESILKGGHSTAKSTRVIVRSDESQGFIFKFEVSMYGEYKLAVGVRLDYEDIIRFGEDMVAKDFIKIKDMAKFTEQSEIEGHTNTYSTLIFDGDMIVRYASSNIYDLFGDFEYLGRRIESIFEEDYAALLKEKMRMLDIFGVMTIDYAGRFSSLSRHDKKYYVLNMYPYSKDTNDRFEELQTLKKRIQKLEAELENKNKLIKVQKTIFENITTIDDLTKLSNRRIFFRDIESEILKAKQLEYQISITILSLENLKDINLFMGTSKGDESLREVAGTIKSLLRKNLDTGYRISSHEFAIISLDSEKEYTEKRFERLNKMPSNGINMEIQMGIFEPDMKKETHEIIDEINKLTHNI